MLKTIHFKAFLRIIKKRHDKRSNGNRLDSLQSGDRTKDIRVEL